MRTWFCSALADYKKSTLYSWRRDGAGFPYLYNLLLHLGNKLRVWPRGLDVASSETNDASDFVVCRREFQPLIGYITLIIVLVRTDFDLTRGPAFGCLIRKASPAIPPPEAPGSGPTLTGHTRVQTQIEEPLRVCATWICLKQRVPVLRSLGIMALQSNGSMGNIQ